LTISERRTGAADGEGWSRGGQGGSRATRSLRFKSNAKYSMQNAKGKMARHFAFCLLHFALL
jgi:hypothetical protein